MTALLQRPDGRVFATGASEYLEEHPEAEGVQRIFIPVRCQDAPRRVAIDTAADKTLLTEETASAWGGGFDRDEDAGRYETRWGTIDCFEATFDVILEASQGQDLMIPIRAKFPRPESLRKPPLDILGYGGALDRIRFAVDASEGELRWYFGRPD